MSNPAKSRTTFTPGTQRGIIGAAVRAGTIVWIAALVTATTARAQGSPVKIQLEGPGSRVVGGALRCAIGDETQFSLNATDSVDQRVVLEQWQPEVTSSDERVLEAKLSESSAYVVNTVCKADGEAWITVHSGDAKLELPALVGRARSRRTPRAREENPPTPATTTGATATAPGQVVSSGRPVQPMMGGSDSGARATGATKKVVTPDAPAVAATGLVLYAGYNNVQLTWRPAPGAAGYRVARKDVAANTLVTLTGDNVARDGTGLVRDTGYFDGSAVAGRQYVYYLATYFQRPNGDYYFPDRNSEARGVATPRSTAGKPWLPSDWKTRPQLKSATVSAGPALNISWHIKPRATGYIYFTYIGTREVPGTACDGRGHVIPALSAPLAGHAQVTMDSSMVKGVPGMIAVDPPLPGETRRRGKTTLVDEQLPVTMYCIAVHAVYPDEVDGSGTPVVSGFNASPADSWWGANAGEGIASKPLWVAIRRTCPSGQSEDGCTPWAVVPTDELPQNAP